MKREIKFRAWDKRRKEWVTPNAYNVLAVSFDGEPIKCHTESCESPVQYANDDVVLMQFTGLTDKNGKEIYEGDIIKSPDEDMDYCIVEWDDKLCCFQINGYGRQMYFNEGGGEEYTNDTKRIEDNILILGSSDIIEVIGNIYENAQP